MRFAVWTVSLLGIIGGTLLPASEPAPKKLASVRVAESSRGDLAYRAAANEPWKVARRGESLPEQASLRTSASGTCRVELESGILQLAAETEAQLLANQRQIVVATGRVFGQSLPGWSVRAGTMQGKLSADTSAEFVTGSD